MPRPNTDNSTTPWLEKPVFLTGATGFIGSYLYPLLVAEGLKVRSATRNLRPSQRRRPRREWVEFDVESPEAMVPAMQGCGSAFYLIHQMGGGAGYRERERMAAEAFREAASEAGIERIVYLGGVSPDGEPSEHLASRLATGQILRDGEVSVIELRASMIIGPGGASWQIVRDLAARLPVMLLPKWTRSRTEPVYIDDVLEALCGALRRPAGENEWYDIPGPEVLSIEEILRRTARQIGHDPKGVRIPTLSPRLSSYWLRFVTRCDLDLARELVEGLKSDLLATDDRFWEIIDHTERVGFDEAVRRTLVMASPESLSARLYEGLVEFMTPIRRRT